MVIGKSFSMVSGLGTNRYSEIESFDLSLINAGIGDYNLVKLSSILPPRTQFRNEIELSKGEILYLAYAHKTIFSSGIVSSAIAVGIPVNPMDVGVIMETSGLQEKDIIEDYAREMVIRAMKKRNIQIEKVMSTSIQAKGKENLYTTTFAGLCIF